MPKCSLCKLRSFRQVSFDDIPVGEQLGEGAYAKVYLGRLDDIDVAIKILNEVADNDDEGFSKAFYEFRREIFIMRFYFSLIILRY